MISHDNIATSRSRGTFTADRHRATSTYAFRTGMSGTPMPSFKDSASDADMWDLANYVASLARKPVEMMMTQEASTL